MTKFTLTLIALTTLTFAAPLVAQETYPSRSNIDTRNARYACARNNTVARNKDATNNKDATKKNSEPAKQVYRGPILSTALPTAGPYSQGISFASSFPRQSTRQSVRRPIPTPRQPVRRPTVDLSFGRNSSLYRVDSDRIARAIVYRSLFSGLGGADTGP